MIQRRLLCRNILSSLQINQQPQPLEILVLEQDKNVSIYLLVSIYYMLSIHPQSPSIQSVGIHRAQLAEALNAFKVAGMQMGILSF